MMGEKLFWSGFVTICVVSMPLLFLGMIYLVAVVNWHDVLLVVTVLVIQYQIASIRRNDKAFDRAVRRYLSRQAVKKFDAGVDGWAEAA
jgi:hypothetical protein